MNLWSIAARAVVALLLFAPGAALAQADFPNRPLRLLVGFPPGGSTDVLSRVLAQEARKALGQEVIIVNKPGASGALAIVDVVASPADGYTIALTPSSTLTLAHEFQQIRPDLLEQTDALLTVGRQRIGIAVKAESDIKTLKDAAGPWVGAYYGIMSIGSNATLVKNPPKTWADLTKPEYKGQVTINGDPREAGAAFAAVVAASLANGGSYDDIMPGIEYFANLKKSGNLQVIDVTEAALLSGDVPIAIDWSYNFPGVVPKLAEAGFDFVSTIPTDGLYGSYYAQSVVSDAVHPCAARLWIEHITGDEGALGYLEGGAIPARYAALDAAGKITPEMKEKLPPADIISQITFPTAAQVEAMKQQLTENWGPMVGDA